MYKSTPTTSRNGYTVDHSSTTAYVLHKYRHSHTLQCKFKLHLCGHVGEKIRLLHPLVMCHPRIQNILTYFQPSHHIQIYKSIASLMCPTENTTRLSTFHGLNIDSSQVSLVYIHKNSQISDSDYGQPLSDLESTRLHGSYTGRL